MVLNTEEIRKFLLAFQRENSSAFYRIPYSVFKELWRADRVRINIDPDFNLELVITRNEAHKFLNIEAYFPKDEFISFYLFYYQKKGENMNDTSSDTVTNPALSAHTCSQINNTTNSSISYTGYVGTGINSSDVIPALTGYAISAKCNEKTSTEKENSMFNFDFGPVGVNEVRMSMNGLAVKNAEGIWVAYDGENINNVDILNFECENFVYKMPVGQNSLNPGDIIYHNKRYLWIRAINDDHLTVVDPCSSDIRDIILTKSPFGFSFCTKVMNLMDSFGNGVQASADNPFGNMWMLMLMNDKAKSKDILPFLLMSQGNTEMNPMLLYALMK